MRKNKSKQNQLQAQSYIAGSGCGGGVVGSSLKLGSGQGADRWRCT